MEDEQGDLVGDSLGPFACDQLIWSTYFNENTKANSFLVAYTHQLPQLLVLRLRNGKTLGLLPTYHS